MKAITEILGRLRKQPPKRDSETIGEDEDDAIEQTSVSGDRGMPSLSKSKSAENRIAGYLVIGVLSAVAVALLVKYYSVQIEKHHAAEEAAGPVKAKDVTAKTTVAPFKEPPPPPPPEEAEPIGIIQAKPPVSNVRSGQPAPPPLPRQLGPDGKPILTPEEQLEQRRLTSPVIVKRDGAGGGKQAYDMGVGAPAQGQGNAGVIGSSLIASSTPGVKAVLLPNRDYLITKGTFIECTLETAIRSSTAGMVRCIQTSDVYSDSGRVLLLERGTVYTGEYKSDMAQGQQSLFVLWTEAKTPLGVVVELASPATDSLGRSGVSGFLDTHFWDRFKSAFLFTAIQTVSQVAQNKSSSGGTNIYSQPMGSGSQFQNVISDVIKPGLQISNSIEKNHGERVGIFVARVLDFRNVYDLRNSR